MRYKDLIRGALYGVAIGDALGAPLEFMSRDAIKAKYGTVTEMQTGGWLNVEKGEVTDDTQMALAVAQGIVESPENPVPAIGKRFIVWAESKPKDIGGICAASIRLASSHSSEPDETVWLNARSKLRRTKMAIAVVMAP